ncbi:MAG TPA: DUF2993 domain-containing protein [Crinalium sp.]
MTQSGPDLGEQALSKVAEVGITSQLDEVEEIDVDIRTNPLKVLQGEVDSVSIEGKGMVMKQDLRMEAVEINTGTVSINPLSTVFGKIELTQPADAEARIILTEDDLNRALQSDYLRSKMGSLELQVNGENTPIDIQNAQIHLPGDEQMQLQADIVLLTTGEHKQLKVKAKPSLTDQGQRIVLEDISFEGHQMSSDLSTALFERVLELLDLRNFDIQGMSMRLEKLKAYPGELRLQAAAQIEKFPSA